MATVVQMQPASRAPVDRSTSFDQTRSRSTPPFPSQHHPSASYDAQRPSQSNSRQHSRNGSNTSANAPYSQPFVHQYFPQPPAVYGNSVNMHQPQAWATKPIPATAFYPSPMQLHPGQSFQQNFQQNQADFAAWAAAYHQMVASSMAQGNNHMAHAIPPRPEYLGDRRRTNSGPSPTVSYPNNAFDGDNSHSQAQSAFKDPRAEYSLPRTVSQNSSRENIKGSLARSTSHPSLVSNDSRPISPPSAIPYLESHRRATSLESNGPQASVQPPRIPSRQDSYRADDPTAARQVSASPSPHVASHLASPRVAPVARVSTPPSTTVVDRPKASQPLHTGPIANAINTPNPTSRPSPLSQSATNVEPEKGKSGGLKHRLRRVLEKDASTPKKQSTTPSMVYQGTMRQPTFPSPSESSTRSTTPPITPPQSNDMPPPARPFVVHPQGMGSEVSLAETERTATAPGGINDPVKAKKSLFRMKNMSTDNISLSSTVSSASMMIRKMGSLGKIARRNSLMGISRIFKDRPKDEDAALPEKEAKKKNKKKEKKDKGKAEATPAVVSHAIAEPDRVSEDEDRTLSGLSPAAKLARQHTLRSRAEQEKRNRESGKTGEPAWDNNTATRTNNVLPSIASVAGRRGSAPEVVHITPGRTSTVVRAVQVAEHEYDSEDDSSDGETVEDVTQQLSRARMSDCSATADAEFRDTWGNVWIDKNAVPKKGILKNKVSMENLAARAARQRSNSTAEIPSAFPSLHPMNQPQADADQIDGIHHASANDSNDEKYDPTSVSFAPFESPVEKPELTFPYSTPAHNTSAPALSLITSGKPLTVRSMTAPASRRLIWAPECAVYSTYDAMTYDRRGEPATCNRLTPELAQEIKQELNAFKLEMPIHPESRSHTHFFA